MFSHAAGFYVTTKQQQKSETSERLRASFCHITTHIRGGGGSEIGPLTFEKHTACARTPFKSAHLFNISCWWFSAPAVCSVVCETK
jgi:hypothetical protein